MNESQQNNLDTNSINAVKEIDIDFIAIAKVLWGERKTILLSTIFGLVIGIFIAFVNPKQYKVSSLIIPQYSGKTSSGGLSALASIAGINIGSSESTGEISPLLYPQIITSVPFQIELMNIPIQFSDVEHPVSVYEYYTQIAKPDFTAKIKKYSIGLPIYIYNLFRSKNIINPNKKHEYNQEVIKLTESQNNLCSFLNSIISLETNAKEGYLKLTVTMSDPIAAAELGQQAQELLQDYVINFKTQKSKQELRFIQERYNSSKFEMEQKQLIAANLNDKNNFLTTSAAKINSERSKTDFQISNSVFLELSKQLEQAKIQVKKDTPTFTVVQPFVIPNSPYGNGKLTSSIIYSVFGFIIGLIISGIKITLPEFMKKFNNQ